MFVYRLAAFLVVFVPTFAMFAERGEAQAPKDPPPEPTRPLLIVASPAGAQIGQSTEITLVGGEVASADSLLFSDPRIKAELIKVTMLDPMAKDKDKTKNPAMGKALPTSEVKFKVSVPAGMTPGPIDVRVVTPGGVSNPRTIVVSETPELMEKEPNNDVDVAQKVELNTSIHGTILTPTDVDYTVFTGKKGQQVVVSCLTSSIDSRLQADLSMFSADGKPIAANRNYRGEDALMSAILPQDSEYYVRVAQFTYTTGGPDHFYRLQISTAPWIDAVYPPIVEPGQTANVTIYGRNLPGGQLDAKMGMDGKPLEKLTVAITAPKTPERIDFAGIISPAASVMDGFSYNLKNPSGTSNTMMMGYARAKISIDNDTNDAMDKAQEVTLPAEIIGRIEQKRDRDWYRFTAKKGDILSVEAFADRLGSPVDLYFALYDGKGKLIGEYDENTDMMHPVQFYTRTEDPQRQRIEIKDDGEYRLMVSTRESYVQAGPRDIYRIYVGPEKPDFRLVVMPSAPYYPEGCVVPKGGDQVLSVFVWRLDGFEGPIDLNIEGLPKGLSAVPQPVGPRARSAAIVIHADKDANPWAGNIRIVGKAKISGKDVVREARPATISWGVPVNQQDQVPSTPLITRMDRSLALAVRDPAAFRVLGKADKAEFIGSPGDKLNLTVILERSDPKFKGPVVVTILGLPTGANITGGNGGNQKNTLIITPATDKTESKVVVDLKKDVPPGKYSVVLRGQTQLAKKGDGNPKNVSALPVSVSSEPIKLTILPTEVAKLKVTPAEAKGRPGESVTITIEIERLYEFDGPIKLEVVFPDGTKNVSVQSVVVPAGKNTAMIALKIANEAKASSLPKVIIKATARVGEAKDIVSEGRLNLTVTK